MLVIDQLKKSETPLRNLALMVTLGMLSLLLGLWYVQVIRSKRYVENEKDQSFRTVRIAAVRGKILDRNRLPLAENRASYNISLYLDELRKQFQQEYKTNVIRLHHRPVKKEREKLELSSRFRVATRAVEQLSQVLQQPISLDEKQFHRHYEIRRVLPLPVLQNLTTSQISRFEEQPFNPPGVDLEVQPTRVYPYGTAASHVLGQLVKDDSSTVDEDAFFNYRMQDFRGVLGLEGYFDKELRGRAGVKSVQVNRLGYRQSENVWTPAEPGTNVILTLDLPVQLAAEAALHSGAAGTNTRGAAIVVNVRNGDVLAMVSSPAYDPNIFVRAVSKEDAERLSDPKLKIQINRATQGQYLPGSIFKIVTGLAALEAGVLDPNEIYDSPGVYPIGRGIHDTAPAGKYDFRRAFIKSSNCYFIEYGRRAGLERLLDMGSRFFLGQPSELPTYNQDKSGIFPTMDWIQEEKRHGRPWTEGNTANICFGQGQVAVTPIQMAMMVAAVANGGNVYWPRLVQRLEPQDVVLNEANIQTVPPRVRGELGVQAKNLEIIRQAMLADVEDPDGTAFVAFHDNRKAPLFPEMRIGGKTGTAQVSQGGRVVDHITWFASYSAAEEPRYAVVVMVESGSSGGGTCAPIAAKIYKALQQREVPAKKTGQIAQLK